MAKVTVDTTELEKLGKDLTVARKMTLGQLGDRAHAILVGKAVWGQTSGEVPYETGNLRDSVQGPLIDERTMTAELFVTGRTAATGPRAATVHYPSGKKKQITLRPRQPFNYAEVVHEGRPAIFPKVGKAILIPVLGAPAGEPYITEGRNIYVVRKSAKAVKPNRFMDRTGARVEAEAPAIVGKIFRELFT